MYVCNILLPTVKVTNYHLLFEVVLWFGGVCSKQRKDISCHVKLQLYCASFVKLVSKDYLHKTEQVAQLSQRDHTAGWVSISQKWRTGTGI